MDHSEGHTARGKQSEDGKSKVHNFAQALRLYKVFRVGGQNIRRKHADRMSTNNNAYVEVRVCRSQWLCGLRVLACWDCGFESRRSHGYVSLVNVVCCQVEVSPSG